MCGYIKKWPDVTVARRGEGGEYLSAGAGAECHRQATDAACRVETRGIRTTL